MSAIVHQLRNAIEANDAVLRQFAQEKKLLAMKAKLSEIGENVRRGNGSLIQLNFPRKKAMLDLNLLGLTNLSLLVHRERTQFRGLSSNQVRIELARRYPRARLTEVGFGWDGYKIEEEEGRIVVLPGAVHFWRKLEDRELDLLDWLFSRVFQTPVVKESSD